MSRLTATGFQRADGVENWRVVGDCASTWFDAPSLTAGAALVGRIADSTVGRSLPDLDLRASGVQVRIGASGSSALTESDLETARAVTAAAGDLGLTGDPAALQTMRLAIATSDMASVPSFWQRVLGYQATAHDRLDDPLRRDPDIRFHLLEERRPLRNRIHVDVVRPPEAVEAVKAGLGSEGYGRWQLTLADSDGNQVDLVPGDGLPDGPGTADWRVLFSAMAFYPTTSAAQAAHFAIAVAGLADHAGFPLLVDVRPDGVTLDSGKDQWEWEDDEHPAGTRFAELASQIQTAAVDVGLVANTTGLRYVQVGIDAVDVPAVRAFWASLLGYEHDPRTYLADIYDPRRLNPVLIFQQMDASEEDRRQQRNRIHVDLFVPHDQARARIDAALAAGGRILSDESPGRCTVADPEDNELDIVTAL